MIQSVHRPKILKADRSDCADMHTLYSHYVLHTTATAEEIVPTLPAYQHQIWGYLKEGHPVLVMRKAGKLMGFAYAIPYRARTGYRFTYEHSIYFAPGYAKRGYGRKLMKRLMQECARRGCCHLIGTVADHNNVASIRFHESMGFVQAALFKGVVTKFNRSLDMVMMHYQYPKNRHEGDAHQSYHPIDPIIP